MRLSRSLLRSDVRRHVALRRGLVRAPHVPKFHPFCAAAFSDDIRGRVLSAAVREVPQHGFTQDALLAGAEAEGLPPMVQGVARGPAELVAFFLREANAKLARHLAERADVLKHLTPTQRLAYAMEHRLRMVQPVLAHWPRAVAIGAFPANALGTAEALALLADELAHAAGYVYKSESGAGGAAKWYADRALISGVYVATELFMLNDESEDNAETWAFLQRRLDGLERAAAMTDPQNLSNMTTTASTAAASLATAAQSLGQGMVANPQEAQRTVQNLLGLAGQQAKLFMDRAQATASAAAPAGASSRPSPSDPEPELQADKPTIKSGTAKIPSPKDVSLKDGKN